MTKTASKMLAKLQTTAFLTFSLKAKTSVYAAWELSKAGLVVTSSHPNNEMKVELKR